MLANRESMMFFETSAKNGNNVNRMMYSCIAELPFFEQFQVANKDQLIKELEGGNNKKEQNSIYDIVKGQQNEKPATDLNVNGQDQNQNQNSETPGVVVIKRRKKKSCC